MTTPSPQQPSRPPQAADQVRGGDGDSYDPRTALLLVDVQNDFADPHGSLSVPGGEAILPLLNAEIARAEAAGATIVYTQDWHPASTPHFHKDGGLWPVHCVAGSWGGVPASGAASGGRRPPYAQGHRR